MTVSGTPVASFSLVGVSRVLAISRCGSKAAKIGSAGAL